MGIGLVLLVVVADGFAVIHRNGWATVLQIAFILVVTEDDQGVEICLAQDLAQMPHRFACLVLALHEMSGRDHVGHGGIGLLQELAVGNRAALLVAMLDLLISFNEARQRLVRGQQHRRMRRSHPEHDPGHRPILQQLIG